MNNHLALAQKDYITSLHARIQTLERKLDAHEEAEERYNYKYQTDNYCFIWLFLLLLLIDSLIITTLSMKGLL